MKRVFLTVVACIAIGAVAPAMTEEAKETNGVSVSGSASKSAVPAQASVKNSVSKKLPPRSDDGRPVSTKSEASRTALCKADCSPAKYDEKTGVGIHGIYRSYQKDDPHLVSAAGKQQYAECVSKCLAPLPAVYLQRAVFALGINWFGKSKQSCLDCHVKGH